MREDDESAGARRGELDAVARLRARLGPERQGERWIGDDAAVVFAGPQVVFASDALVDGVHFDRRCSTLADVGWKALTTNLSDIAAMGGRPIAAVVAICGAQGDEIDELYDGLVEASRRYSCPIVGGDLTSGPTLMVSLALLGAPGDAGVVFRSGGRPGDVVFLTGPTGAAAAGLRMLRADEDAAGPLVFAHRRPTPRLIEGEAAGRAGATAMIDVSDGLGIDLDRLCAASGVGAALDRLPVAPGATAEEALSGGDDYELLFSAPDAAAVASTFAAVGLAAPEMIGRLVEDPRQRTLEGAEFEPRGYLHPL